MNATEITKNFENGALLMVTSNRQPAWLAEVDSLDSKYGFHRNFIQKDEFYIVGRCIAYDLAEGTLYNWSEEKGVQHFGFVKNGKLYEVSKDDAKKIVTGEETIKPEPVKKEIEAVETEATENETETEETYVYYVNSIDKSQEGFEPRTVEKAIFRLIEEGKIKISLGKESYDEYEIAKSLNTDKDLRSWALKNYTLFPIPNNFTDEWKKIYETEKPGQVEISYDTFKKYCLKTIKALGPKKVVLY